VPTRKAAAGPIAIKPLDVRVTEIEVVGKSELIVHQWSEKAKRQMLDKQMGKAQPKKEKKDPEADYEASKYRLPDGGCGFPASGFKAAIVGACRLFDGLTMTQVKVCVRVLGEDDGELVRIVGEPRMREDMVRLESGVADIRHRAGFPEWRAKLRIRHIANVVTDEILLNLVSAAGEGGVGEWRPSAPNSVTGSFGCFEVATGD